jgi:putative ABC transport system permease protein
LRGSMADAGRSNVATRHSLQWLFVGVQVALSVTLLAGAGLLVRSFQELWRVERGFEPSQVLSFRVTGSYGEGGFDRMVQDVETMLAGLQALPGVEAAATSSPVPGVLEDGSGFEFGTTEFPLVEPIDDPDLRMVAAGRVVSPTYFDAMQIALLSGDVCRSGTGRAPEVMVNRAFATRYLAGRPATGLHLTAYGARSRIAGVVSDAREFGLAREPVPMVYMCSTFVAFPPLAFLLRTSGDPTAIVDAVRTKLAQVQPQRSMFDVVPLERRMGEEYAQNRLRTILLAMFAGTALALTVLGVYGTLSYVVSLRRREIGLRLAVGAAQRNIVAHFLRKALGVVGLALVAGVALSLGLGRLLAGMLFGVSAADPATLGGVVLLVVGVAALAATLPALRASRIDPMQALREE